MKIEFKITLLSIFLFITNGYSQENSIKNFVIPDNEFIVSRMVEDLQDERKTLNLELKHCDRLVDILVNNKIKLESYELKQTLEKFEDIERIFFTELNLKRIGSSEYERFSNYELQDIARNSRLSLEIFYLKSKENTSDDKKDFNKIFNDGITILKSDAETHINSVEKIKDKLNTEINVIEQKLKKLYNHKGQNKDLHKIAITMGLPAFCITILLLFLIPYYLERKTVNSDPNVNNKQYLLDVATVLLLTMTILILGLAKMITGEVLGTLLGGISGYVLNRTMKK